MLFFGKIFAMKAEELTVSYAQSENQRVSDEEIRGILHSVSRRNTVKMYS